MDKPFESRKRFCNPRYIGDLTREHFTSDIAWNIIKKHVNNYGKNRKSLTEKVKRATNKIESLKSLLNNLRKKGLLSDEVCNKLDNLQ